MVQLRISCGNCTAEKSLTAWLKPMTSLEVAAKVNAVDQYIQIERIRQRFRRIVRIKERIGRITRNRIKGIRVSILRRMTLRADFHFGTDPAVEGKGLVTPLAVLRLHH